MTNKQTSAHVSAFQQACIIDISIIELVLKTAERGQDIGLQFHHPGYQYAGLTAHILPPYPVTKLKVVHSFDQIPAGSFPAAFSANQQITRLFICLIISQLTDLIISYIMYLDVFIYQIGLCLLSLLTYH